MDIYFPPIGPLVNLRLLFTDTVFYYHAFWAASKLKLSCPWRQHCAVGLLGVLIDIPYDITGIRFLNWTWHDTDPNIFDRMYFVPWTSYFFHFTFSCSMSIILFYGRRPFGIHQGNRFDKAGPLVPDIVALLATCIFSFPLGALMFMVSYHVLHDFLLIPTETVVMPIFAIIFLFIWSGDRNNFKRLEGEKSKGVQPKTLMDKLLCVHLCIHYLTYLAINIFLNPEEHISISYHETIGNCSETQVLQTLLKNLEKKAFLCVDDYDEKYYNFDCLKEVPPQGSSWYAICGTPFE